MRTPSIRRSLLIRCGAGVGILMCVLSTGIYLTVRHGLYHELDQSIEQTAALLADQVELENEAITFEWQEGMGTNKTAIDSGLFQFWDESTGFTTRSPGLQSMNLPKFCGPNGAPSIKDIHLPGNHGRARAIGLRIYPFVLPAELERMKARGRILETKDIPHILVVARDSGPVRNVLVRLRWILAGGTLVTLGVGFLLIHRATRVALRPIDLLAAQVREREGRRLDSPLKLPHTLPSELTDLADSFNALLSRLAVARRREGEFIRHAAHELRTPIAGLLATTELALSKPRENSSYREHLEDLRETAVDLGSLVKRLFALERSDAANTTASPVTIHLPDLIASRLPSFQKAFDARGLSVRECFCTECTVSADRMLLTVILNNLLDNAACYATANGVVGITIARSGDQTELIVSNDVEELPDDLDRMFEPLFRHDGARSDGASHLGIGLTLSQNAANSMGTALVARRSGVGAVEFVLSLPHVAG